MNLNFDNTLSNSEPHAKCIIEVECLEANLGTSKAGNPTIYSGLKVTEVLWADGPDDTAELIEGTTVRNVSSCSPKALGFLRDFLESLGFEARDLSDFDADNVGEDGADECLIGRRAFCQYTPSDPANGKKYAEKVWLSEAKARATADALNAAAGASDAEIG